MLREFPDNSWQLFRMQHDYCRFSGPRLMLVIEHLSGWIENQYGLKNQSLSLSFVRALYACPPNIAPSHLVGNLWQRVRRARRPRLGVLRLRRLRWVRRLLRILQLEHRRTLSFADRGPFSRSCVFALTLSGEKRNVLLLCDFSRWSLGGSGRCRRRLLALSGSSVALFPGASGKSKNLTGRTCGFSQHVFKTILHRSDFFTPCKRLREASDHSLSIWVWVHPNNWMVNTKLD